MPDLTYNLNGGFKPTTGHGASFAPPGAAVMPNASLGRFLGWLNVRN
jgi:hypothetical protein